MIDCEDGGRFYTPQDALDEGEDAFGMVEDVRRALARGEQFWRDDEEARPHVLLMPRYNGQEGETWWVYDSHNKPTPEQKRAIEDIVRLQWA